MDSKKHILLIEDDNQFREFVREVLEGADYQVSEADNGHTGLNLLETITPDLILTDLLMPEKDGVRTITEIKVRHAHIPIIAMSGGQSVFSPVFLEAAATLGATKTLSKPFQDTELLQLVASLLE